MNEIFFRVEDFDVMKTGAVKPIEISLTVAFFFSESQFC